MPNTKKQVLLSNRLDALKPSLTLALTAKAAELRSEGRPIISFGAGEPDFDTPTSIKQAGIEAIQSGHTRYTPVGGTASLKTAVINYLQKDRGLTYAPNQIVVSSGAKHSLANLFLALLNPGDEVIIPAPYWVSYPDQVLLAGGNPIIAPTNAEFKLTPDTLEATLTPQSKLLILNSPSNPTGAVYTRDELLALAPIIEAHNLLVISDEIYSQLRYDGIDYTSPAQLSDYLYENTIVVDGVSKAYAMTGWRIGFLAGDAAIAKAVTTIQSQMTSNPCTPAQYASEFALSIPVDPEHVRLFEGRRNRLVAGLNAIPGLSCPNPAGAFYVFPSIAAVLNQPNTPGGPIKDSLDFCDRLLAQQDVVCIPGDAFGASDSIRLSYALSDDAIETGLSRIKVFMEDLV
ncbi:MAG: pyridoxal phosphate-dependent aminotransferase [bacterium]|nr:pyridoxal phosphate-dependent aminotransferase [bacterium]